MHAAGPPATRATPEQGRRCPCLPRRDQLAERSVPFPAPPQCAKFEELSLFDGEWACGLIHALHALHAWLPLPPWPTCSASRPQLAEQQLRRCPQMRAAAPALCRPALCQAPSAAAACSWPSTTPGGGASSTGRPTLRTRVCLGPNAGLPCSLPVEQRRGETEKGGGRELGQPAQACHCPAVAAAAVGQGGTGQPVPRFFCCCCRCGLQPREAPPAPAAADAAPRRGGRRRGCGRGRCRPEREHCLGQQGQHCQRQWQRQRRQRRRSPLCPRGPHHTRHQPELSHGAPGPAGGGVGHSGPELGCGPGACGQLRPWQPRQRQRRGVPAGRQEPHPLAFPGYRLRPGHGRPLSAVDKQPGPASGSRPAGSGSGESGAAAAGQRQRRGGAGGPAAPAGKPGRRVGRHGPWPGPAHELLAGPYLHLLPAYGFTGLWGADGGGGRRRGSESCAQHGSRPGGWCSAAGAAASRGVS